MARWFSLIAARDRCHRRSFAAAGLRPYTIDLGDGTTIRCWAPRSPSPSPSRPAVLLIHGFGAGAAWQWSTHVRPLRRAGFDVYVPDLLFFGGSATSRPERSESFQAACVVGALEALGVERLFALVGISYGGFVGYRVAAMFPEAVGRVVLCCPGVCLEERDLAVGLFPVSNVAEAVSLLIPRSPESLRRMMRLSFCKRPPALPAFVVSDYIHVMFSNYVEEKTGLIHALIKDRKLSELPKITQPTLIIWGEQDQVFPLELGHRLKGHLEGNSQLVVIKNAGHAVNIEKSKEFHKHFMAFLTDSSIKGFNKHKATRWWFSTRDAGLGMKRLPCNLPLLSGERP